MKQLLDAALFYASIHWPVFPCKPGTKVPDGAVVPHGVKHATTDAGQIQKWWEANPNYNIGFACGGEHGIYVVDVDVDIEKGINGLESLKEFQIIYGIVQDTPRGGKHLFYHSANKVVNSPKFRHGMEIRGSGYYVMLAPSVHPNSKVYRWVQGKEPWSRTPPEFPYCLLPAEEQNPPLIPTIVHPPIEIDASELAGRICRWIVTKDAAVQGDHGHDKLLNVAGELIHGWECTPAEVYAILVTEYNPRCEPPWDLSSQKDERDFRRKIDQAIKNPMKKQKGWLKNDPAYAPMAAIPSPLADSIKGLTKQISSGVIAAPATVFKVDPLRAKPPASELKFLCSPLGKLGELCSWINSSSIREQPFLTLGCSIVFLGALFGRKVKDNRGGRTNLYGMGIGKSSSGKGHAQDCVREICTRTNALDLLGGTDFTGDTAIEKQLSLHPSTLYLLDEIGHILLNIKGSSNQYTAKIVPTLMKLWSSAKGTFVGKHFADREKIRQIIQPCCCFWGTSVPGRFFASLSPEELYDGWLSRCMVFRTEDKPRKNKNYEEQSPPSDICDWVESWFNRKFGDPDAEKNITQWQNARHGEVQSAGPVMMVVPTTDEANGIFSKLDDFSHDVGDRDNELGCLWDKAEESARRVALVQATSIDYDNPVIDGACADFATRLIFYLLYDFGYATVGRIVGSIIEEKKNKIVMSIATAGIAGRNKNSLTKDTPWLRISEREELVRDLNEAGRLISRVSGKEMRYWTPEYFPGG